MPFVIALAVTAAAVPLLMPVGERLGLVDRPGEGDLLKIHGRAVPVVGGLAVLAGAVCATAVAHRGISGPSLAAVAVALGVGTLDDARPLGPGVRLALLAGAGVLMGAGVARVEGSAPLVVAGVAALVVATTNAANLMDGQDGLAGGLALAGALAMAVAAREVDPAAASFALGLGGALAGFLIWNRPQARVFLGNGGAYAVGAMLALVAARLVLARGWPGFLAAGLALGPFAFELVFTVARRAAAGRSTTGGDRGHSYDLVSARLGRVPTTLAFWAVGATSAALAVPVASSPVAPGLAVAGALAVVAAAAGLRLMTEGRRRSLLDPVPVNHDPGGAV